MLSLTKQERQVVFLLAGVILGSLSLKGCLFLFPKAESVVNFLESNELRAVVDINSARKEDLLALPGVGPVLARRILESRERLGNFESVEDLRRVTGIGPRKLENMLDRVRVGSL